jgi:CO/xanthine dehydrogenase Mo-binding subunit
MQTDSPESVTLAHWDWNFTVFWCDTGASVSMRFFGSFPQKSVILAFERKAAEALGDFWRWRWGFGEHAFP